jgi:hypothetical protein
LTKHIIAFSFINKNIDQKVIDFFSPFLYITSQYKTQRENYFIKYLQIDQSTSSTVGPLELPPVGPWNPCPPGNPPGNPPGIPPGIPPGAPPVA